MLSRATSLAFLLLAAFPAGVAAAEWAPGLEILTRAEWGARAPVMTLKRNVPARITIHHTATPMRASRSLASKLVNLQDFSQSSAPLADGRKKPRWGDLPYHFYVDANGAIGEGLEIGNVGDTNTAYDPSGHVSIVIEGNFENEEPSAAQLDSVARLVAYLSRTYDIPPDNWGVHQDFAATACPGAHFLEHWPAVSAEAQRLLAAPSS